MQDGRAISRHMAPFSRERCRGGPEAYFAGRWNEVGQMKPGPMGPGGQLTSTSTCEWFAGGFSIVCRSDGKGPTGEMHGLGILGFSTERKRYTYYGVDNSGMGG